MDSALIDSAATQVKHRLNSLQTEIADTARSAGRNIDEITVVGVTKLHPPEMTAAAYQAGLTHIGESRIQETVGKKPIIDAYLSDLGVEPGVLCWHLIGTLQSNKAAKSVELFDVIESVDSLRLAKLIARHAVERGKVVRIFLEVNISGEDSKSGFPFPQPDETGFFETIGEISEMPGLKVEGLMGIGPLTDDQARITASFEALRELRDQISQTVPSLRFGGKLSMGMSDDYPLAIAAGSTQIRVGTALFGKRMQNAE